MQNRAILVTGSTRGIGRAIAAELVAAGALVGVHGRNRERVQRVCETLSTAPDQTIPLTADFADPDSAAALVRNFARAAGRIDGLVNCAGSGRPAAFRALTTEKWQATFRVNLDALVAGSREAYIDMRSRGAGSIVNIASLAAHGPGRLMGADYAASKAGVVSVTKSLALEAARFGIRVNAVSPGLIETDMSAALTPEQRAATGIPLGRFGRPSEIAAVVRFLLSAQAAYVTGQIIHADGGLWMGASG